MDNKYMQEVRELVPYDGSLEDLVTMTEAAEILGISVPGVSVAMDRGAFPTVVHNTERARATRGRRLLVRAEVLARRETVRKS